MNSDMVEALLTTAQTRATTAHAAADRRIASARLLAGASASEIQNAIADLTEALRLRQEAEGATATVAALTAACR